MKKALTLRIRKAMPANAAGSEIYRKNALGIADRHSRRPNCYRNYVLLRHQAPPPGLGGTPPIGTWASGVNAEWTTDRMVGRPNDGFRATGTFNNAIFDGTAAALSITSGGVFANSITVNQNGYSFASGTLTLQNQAKIVVAFGKSVNFGSTMAGTAGYNVSGGGTFNITTTSGTITGPVSCNWWLCIGTGQLGSHWRNGSRRRRCHSQ